MISHAAASIRALDVPAGLEVRALLRGFCAAAMDAMDLFSDRRASAANVHHRKSLASRVERVEELTEPCQVASC